MGRTGASMNSSETSSLTLSVARDGMNIKKYVHGFTYTATRGSRKRRTISMHSLVDRVRKMHDLAFRRRVGWHRIGFSGMRFVNLYESSFG